MTGNNLVIKKGAVFAYRLYDVAHEIDLKKAQAVLEAKGSQQVRRYQLQKDPLRTVIMREFPLTLTGDEETIKIKLKDGDRELKATVEVKLWDYGVMSFCYRINLTENLSWKNLVLLGSILDSDSVIDELSVKKRDELVARLQSNQSLKSPHTHQVFEDYTTYLIEEIESVDKVKKKGKPDAATEGTSKTEPTEEVVVKIRDPKEILTYNCVAELLLAEPTRALSETTRKSIQSNYSQYTQKDLIVLDWNSALVMDFTKEKEYQDYVDLIEFSLAQLLELRIYDQLLDQQLDELYNSMELKHFAQVTNFYSQMSDESGRLYMEFSDFFEKLDNSIKTVGDFYLAKVLRSADKRFGFEELKKSMSRKIDALRELSSMCQDKVDSLVEEQRNKLSEHHIKVGHRMELIVIILIAIEVIPAVYSHTNDIVAWGQRVWTWFANLF
jgi:hypothetical protein